MRRRILDMKLAVGGKKKAKFGTSLVLRALFLSLFMYSSVQAESDIKEGYDENTEISVKGKITEILPWEKGPLVIKLATSSKTYELITAPPWYLSQQNISLFQGLEIEVTGSKYAGSDGAVYIISCQIRFPATGKILTLRDSAYRPIWGKHKRHNRFP